MKGFQHLGDIRTLIVTVKVEIKRVHHRTTSKLGLIYDDYNTGNRASHLSSLCFRWGSVDPWGSWLDGYVVDGGEVDVLAAVAIGVEEGEVV